MIETKFKETEVGKIPEDWEVKSLASLIDECGYGIGAEAVNFDGINKYLRITDIDDKSHNFKPSPLVSPSIIDDSYIAKKDDLFIARTGASVGKSYLYNKKDGRLYYAGFLIKVHIKHANSIIVFYNTLTERYNRWVISESARTGQPGINAIQLKSLKIILPKDRSEQNRIADILSNIDVLISQLDKLIEKKRAIKQGAMQELLTGKKRLKGFSEPWVEINFSQIYKFAKEGGTPDTSNTNFYKPSFIPFIKIEDLKNKYIVNGKDYISKMGIENSSAWEIPNNSVLLSNGATLGEVSITKRVVCTKQGILGIVLKQDFDAEFIYYLFKSKFFKNEMDKVTTHGTMDCAYLKDLNNILLYLPLDIKEQIAISTLLSKMDSEISSLESKRSKYIAIKQGMMQQLLTGKIRLI